MSDTKENSKKQQEKKVPFNKIMSDYRMLLNHNPAIITLIKHQLKREEWDPFHKRWHVTAFDGAANQIYEECDTGLKPVVDKYCAEQVATYALNFLVGDHRCVNLRLAKDIVDNWVATVEKKRIKLFAFADDREIAHVRLPWIKGEYVRRQTPTPLFNDLFARIANGEALQKFIGSVFFEESYRQQYVWVHGEGGDGKGVLTRALQKALGHLFCSPLAMRADDSFWAASCVGRRLAVIADTDKAHFIKGDFFKGLTGDDPIEINPKGKDRFTTNLFTKFICFSNTKPSITSRASDMRRIIFCSFMPKENPPSVDEIETFEDKIQHEIPAFLDQCIAEAESNGIRRPIPCDIRVAEELADATEEHYETLFQTNFEKKDDGEVYPEEFLRFCRTEKLTDIQIGAFKEYLERKYKVRKNRVQRNNQRAWVYSGISFKLKTHDTGAYPQSFYDK